MIAGTGAIIFAATSTTFFFAIGASSIMSAKVSFTSSFAVSTTATSEGREMATGFSDSIAISLDSVFDEFFAHVTFLS